MSAANKKWLADRLYEQVEKEQHHDAPLAFPHLSKDFHISAETEDLTLGPLPENFDFEAETAKMWEELSL